MVIPGNRALGALATALLLLALGVTGASAQSFRAMVKDSATGIPLEGALLRILDSTGATLAQRETDDRGLVTGQITGEAVVYFAVTRIGYRPFLSQPVALGGAPVGLSFGLASQAFSLPDLEVRAFFASALDRTGFTDRERFGFGHFIDPSKIERQRPSALYLLDYLRNIPGVTITQGSNGTRGLRFSGVASANRGCNAPKVYVDGVSMGTGPDLDALVMASDVMAIEVYRRPVEIPAEYGGSSSACGVLLIWTRRGMP